MRAASETFLSIPLLHIVTMGEAQFRLNIHKVTRARVNQIQCVEELIVSMLSVKVKTDNNGR